jgi:hypothetical protein
MDARRADFVSDKQRGWGLEVLPLALEDMPVKRGMLSIEITHVVANNTPAFARYSKNKQVNLHPPP